MPVRCCGIIEIPSIGDLLTKIALEPMRVEDAYEIVHTVLSIAPNQMAIWVAINEAHVPYGTIAKLSKPLFKALAGDSQVEISGSRGTLTVPIETAEVVDGTVWLPECSTGEGINQDLAPAGGYVTITPAREVAQ